MESWVSRLPPVSFYRRYRLFMRLFPRLASVDASKTARLVQSNLAHARRAVPITCPPSQTVSHCALYSSVITSHHVLSTPISDSISVCSCRSEHRSAAQLRSCEGWSCSPKDDLR